MAFRMNKPIIKGSAVHKKLASAIKAKQSIVPQTKTKADPSLTQAGIELGKSYVPKAIDYGIDITQPKWAKKK